MDRDAQETLIRSFSDMRLHEIFDEMFLDDTVDIIEEMPANVVKRIIATSDAETRRAINELLHYPEDSAGSIMTVEYVSLKPEMTVRQAIDHIRETGVDKETIYTCYVTDDYRHLLGVCTAKDLLLADAATLVSAIMDTNVIYASTTEDKEDVAKEMSKYDFLAMPVADKEKRLVGIVTFDDAIDVIEDEATEDIEKMAAITPSDKPYLKTSPFEIWKSRAGCSYSVHTDADGYRRKRRKSGIRHCDTRSRPRRHFHPQHLFDIVERMPCFDSLRRDACRLQLRQDTSCR